MAKKKEQPCLSDKVKVHLYNANVFYLFSCSLFMISFLIIPTFTVLNPDTSEVVETTSIGAYLLKTFFNTLFKGIDDPIGYLINFGPIFFIGLLALLNFLSTFFSAIKFWLQGSKKKKITSINKEFYGTKKEIKKAKAVYTLNVGTNFIVLLFTLLLALAPFIRSFRDIIPATIYQYVDYVLFPYSAGFTGLWHFAVIFLGFLTMLCRNFRAKSHRYYARLIKEK